ncbi:hypothetical protein FRB95_004704 [Tulasnella sp. JGI-2019a]|nr:hypothetical protein FRB95_004704 [Tulasnella sp. JGI-2019a]
MTDTPDTSPSPLKRKGVFEDGGNKRPKNIDDLLSAMERLEKHLELLEQIPNFNTSSFPVIQGVMADIRSENYNDLQPKILSRSFEKPEWSENLGSSDIKRYDVTIRMANSRLSDVLKLFTSIFEARLTPPPPSEYARASVWKEWQTKEQAILCLRPPRQLGLPLSVLHDVFRKFQLQVDDPLSQTNKGASFLEAAYSLCNAMGFNFRDVNQRSQAFEQSVQPILKYWSPEYPVSASAELYGDQVYTWPRQEGVLTVIREGKTELGEGHDAYMKASRAYQVYVTSLREKKSPLLDQGAPTFLLAIQEPMFLLSGGFYDGKSIIVEPLAHPCMMLYDHSGRRQDDLARQLFASRNGITTIVSLGSKEQLTSLFAPATPRIYQSFIDSSGEEQRLTFVAPLDGTLMFLAKTTKTPEVLVKLVRGEYGETVHRVLADCGLAPTLHATMRIEGALTAIVMEYLQPLSTGGSSRWSTLYDLEKYEDVEPYKEII